MYLSNLSNAQKELFLDLSILAMKSDGVVEEREQELICQYCTEMGIEKRDNIKSENADEVLRKLRKESTNAELKSITVELVALMCADEDFADEESELLDKLKNIFGFSSHLMGEIIFATKHLLLSHKMIVDIVRE